MAFLHATPSALLERVFERSVSTSSRLKASGMRLFMAMVMAGHRFGRNHGFGRAAELAYSTLFALVPVTALALMVVTTISASAERLQRFVFEHLLPSSSLIVSEYLNEFARRAETIGVVSLIFLIIAAISLLHAIESAINDIWEIHARRSFMVKIAAYWSLLTLGPVLLLGSFYLTTELGQSLTLADFLGFGFIRQIITNGLSLLFIWTAFFLLYTQLPNIRVSVSAGLVGGIVSGTLWHVAKTGFDWYVAQAVAYSRIYGSLSVIPLFLLWLYLSWLIILWGTELSYAWQNHPFLKGRLSADLLTGWNRLDAALRVLIRVARGFRNGEGEIGLDAIAADTHLDIRHVRSIADTLIRGRMLYCIDESSRAYVLARAPESIAVAEILALFDTSSAQADPNDAEDVYVTALIGMIRDAVHERLEGVTVRTILEELDAPQPLAGEKINVVEKTTLSHDRT